MWMLTDLKQQNEVAMTELGLLIPAEQIYNPNGIALKDAVVHFGGGCTGEVISAEGLVLTIITAAMEPSSNTAAWSTIT